MNATDLIKVLDDKKILKHLFKPEVKVRRESDTLFISEIRKTSISYLAIVEVGVGGDKAPVPLTVLDERTLGAIHGRLTA